MTTQKPELAATPAELDAARLLLARMGLSPEDLLTRPTARPPLPTFTEYIRIVSAAVTDGTRRVYGSYWNRIDQHWGHRHLDELTPSEIKQLVEHVKTNAEVDLSDVVLVGVKHSKGTAVDISLTGDGELKGINAAGTGARKEPKYVALQVVIDKMNDLFGAESFTASQVREFVQGLVQRLLAYPDLVNQTKVNSKKQFVESQDFQAAVTEAVVENQEAHNTMADYFFSDGPGISAVIMALADAFYEAAIDQQTEV